MRPVVLLTGFEPFGSWTRNVTREAVAALDGEQRDGIVLRALELPVAWPRVVSVLERGIELARPSAVVSFGIHADPDGPFRVETLAANELDFGIPDNDGRVQRGFVAPGHPPVLGATLPVLELERAIASRGLRVVRSENAGRYLCNATYYTLLRTGLPAAFVHVPPREGGESWDDVLAAVDASASVAARAVAVRASSS